MGVVANKLHQFYSSESLLVNIFRNHPYRTAMFFQVNTTVGKCFLKFATLCLIEIVQKITSSMHFVTYFTRHFFVIFQVKEEIGLSIQGLLKIYLVAYPTPRPLMIGSWQFREASRSKIFLEMMQFVQYHVRHPILQLKLKIDFGGSKVAF